MFVSFILKTAEEAERDKEEVLPPVAAQLKGILKPETPISEEWDYRNILDDTPHLANVTNVVKLGAGTLVATPSSTYCGDWTIAEGVFECKTADAFG